MPSEEVKGFMFEKGVAHVGAQTYFDSTFFIHAYISSEFPDIVF